MFCRMITFQNAYPWLLLKDNFKLLLNTLRNKYKDLISKFSTNFQQPYLSRSQNKT